MKKLNIFNSLIEKCVRKHETFKVNKASDLYSYIANECPCYFEKDNTGSFLIESTTYDVDKEKKLRKIARTLLEEPTIVKIGSESYAYFKDEFVKNGMSTDIYGNFLVRTGEEPKAKVKKF